MRRPGFLWLAIGLISCSKGEEKTAECQLLGAHKDGMNYLFDDQGRIVSIQNNLGGLTSFNYTADKVTMTSTGSEIVYYLNSGGLADSSYSVHLVPVGTGSFDTIKSRQQYSYENGYLVRKLNIGKNSLPFGGFTDTIQTSYFYQNGNLVKISSDYYLDLFFKYDAGVSSMQNPLLDPRPAQWNFLGKVSEHAPDRQVDATGNLMSKFVYVFDGNGRVVNRKTYSVSSSMQESVDFSYQCD
jgi:hypothetical protein